MSLHKPIHMTGSIGPRGTLSYHTGPARTARIFDTSFEITHPYGRTVRHEKQNSGPMRLKSCPVECSKPWQEGQQPQHGFASNYPATSQGVNSKKCAVSDIIVMTSAHRRPPVFRRQSAKSKHHHIKRPRSPSPTTTDPESLGSISTSVRSSDVSGPNNNSASSSSPSSSSSGLFPILREAQIRWAVAYRLGLPPKKPSKYEKVIADPCRYIDKLRAHTSLNNTNVSKSNNSNSNSNSSSSGAAASAALVHKYATLYTEWWKAAYFTSGEDAYAAVLRDMAIHLPGPSCKYTNNNNNNSAGRSIAHTARQPRATVHVGQLSSGGNSALLKPSFKVLGRRASVQVVLDEGSVLSYNSSNHHGGNGGLNSSGAVTTAAATTRGSSQGARYTKPARRTTIQVTQANISYYTAGDGTHACTGEDGSGIGSLDASDSGSGESAPRLQMTHESPPPEVLVKMTSSRRGSTGSHVMVCDAIRRGLSSVMVSPKRMFAAMPAPWALPGTGFSSSSKSSEVTPPPPRRSCPSYMHTGQDVDNDEEEGEDRDEGEYYGEAKVRGLNTPAAGDDAEVQEFGEKAGIMRGRTANADEEDYEMSTSTWPAAVPAVESSITRSVTESRRSISWRRRALSIMPRAPKAARRPIPWPTAA